MNDANSKATRTRDGKGQYTRSLATAERLADAVRLHDEGHTYREIAAELGIAVSTAHYAVRRALDHVIREPAEQAINNSLHNLAEARARLLDERTHLEGLRGTVTETLGHQHSTVSHGKVVYDEASGEPVPDDEFILKAVDRLTRIAGQLQSNEALLQSNDESRRRLEGLDQPAKTVVSGGVTYEIIGIDRADLA